jgi:hypothetical protein
MRCRMDVREDAVVAYYELLFKNDLGMIEINHEKHQDWTLCVLKKFITHILEYKTCPFSRIRD